MKFTGCTCAYCNNIFNETDDVVVCPVCGSPHHRECYKEKGSCANDAMHSEGFSWIFPEELRPKEEKKPAAPEAIETNYKFRNGENAVMCPHCKALNYGNDAFCMRCRKSLTGEEEFTAEPSDTNENQDFSGNMPPQGNGFDYFQQFGGVRPDIMIDGIPAAEYADYIGEKKSGRYIRRFLNMERFGRKISVSLCAFIFGPIWYFYRKMFKEGLLFLVGILVLTSVMTWCSVTEASVALYKEMGEVYGEVISGNISMSEMQEILTEKEQEYLSKPASSEDRAKEIIYTVAEVLDLALMLGMSFFADFLYKRKTKADILKIREECSDMITYRRTLRERGGTSTGGAVIAVIAVVAISVIKLLPGYYYMFSNML